MYAELLKGRYSSDLVAAVRQLVENYTDVTITKEEALVLIHRIEKGVNRLYAQLREIQR